MARRGRFELPRVKPTGLAIQRDGQAMRTSQEPHDPHFSFKPSGLLTLLHQQLVLDELLRILHGQ